MADVVVTGAGGMIGSCWTDLLVDMGESFVSYSRDEFDITDDDAIARSIPATTRYVVNCAAWTAVDRAEDEELAAACVNADAVAGLAKRCASIGATLVHYSTDYVFAGDRPTPYDVDAPHAPLNAYGRGKFAGERAIVESGAEYVLVRTSWVYAAFGTNFVRTIARLCREREELRVVNDQTGCPTSAAHAAAISMRLLERGARGTFHVTDGGQCTWFDFATHIARVVNPACRVIPCTSEEYPQRAARPRYGVLDVSRTEATLGEAMPSWQRNVDTVLTSIHGGE